MLYQRYFLRMNQSNTTHILSLLLALVISLAAVHIVFIPLSSSSFLSAQRLTATNDSLLQNNTNIIDEAEVLMTLAAEVVTVVPSLKPHQYHRHRQKRLLLDGLLSSYIDDKYRADGDGEYQQVLGSRDIEAQRELMYYLATKNNPFQRYINSFLPYRPIIYRPVRIDIKN